MIVLVALSEGMVSHSVVKHHFWKSVFFFGISGFIFVINPLDGGDNYMLMFSGVQGGRICVVTSR